MPTMLLEAHAGIQLRFLRSYQGNGPGRTHITALFILRRTFSLNILVTPTLNPSLLPETWSYCRYSLSQYNLQCQVSSKNHGLGLKAQFWRVLYLRPITRRITALRIDRNLRKKVSVKKVLFRLYVWMQRIISISFFI